MLIVNCSNPTSGSSSINKEQDSTLYFILGIIDDYMGRFIVENGLRVESFYPAETTTSIIFQEYINKLIEENNIKDTLIKEVIQSGHIEFNSRKVTEYINNCYVYDLESSSMLWLNEESIYVPAVRSHALKPEITNNVDNIEKLAFLKGLYIRNNLGSDGNCDSTYCISFVNSVYRYSMAEEYLLSFNCTDLSVEDSPPDAVPFNRILYFKPSEVIDSLFKNAKQLYEQYDSLPK